MTLLMRAIVVLGAARMLVAGFVFSSGWCGSLFTRVGGQRGETDLKVDFHCSEFGFKRMGRVASR